MGLWSRTYVCCAVPLYNGGIYAILAQFLIVSIVTGVLCFAAPSIVSVVTPSFVSYILGVLCFAVAACQPVGFFGVYRERPRLFKGFLRINGLLVTAAVLCALAMIVVSAAKHSTAIDNCRALFSTDDTDSTAHTICNIWTWIQIGIMGLLFVIVGLCQVYFVCYTSIYASEQRLDHAKYDTVYSHAAEEIRASGLYDSSFNYGTGRPSYSQDELSDPHRPSYAEHGRNLSKSSGLRNELARGETQEYLNELEAGQGGGERRQGGKLRKGGSGGSSDGGNQAPVVYADNYYSEQYDYNSYEGGFRPPHQSSEMNRPRY
ncbi:hypothetical protein JCM10908_000894 [Rhodotorula pacifica]|uniref:uncharacterized protein n=1 Tax=Rhodotorula pacifica TaxID=1495444 RepID=UPI00316F2C5C